MTVPAALWQQVRRRAGFACEYCGVAEDDAGGQLTVDHFHPQSLGGGDEPDNLLYCCHRCNLYKADYWPAKPGDPVLWHPRRGPMAEHLLALADGTLYPVTPTGAFSLRRLRLNRPPLVAYRRRKLADAEALRLLERYRDVVAVLEQLQRQHAALLEEQRALIAEQRALLRVLLEREQGQ